MCNVVNWVREAVFAASLLFCALGSLGQSVANPGAQPPRSARMAGVSVPQRAEAPAKVPGQLVIIDTDVGEDVDDAFAMALAMQSPEVRILGITTAWGDTKLRARLAERFLQETERTDIPVAVGVQTHPGQGWPDAVDFLLRQIREHPGEITLIAIGPETNLGAAIDRDAATFRRLERVVLMGGSVYRGYGRIRVSDGGAACTAGMEHPLRCGRGAESVCVGRVVVRDASRFHAD